MELQRVLLEDCCERMGRGTKHSIMFTREATNNSDEESAAGGGTEFQRKTDVVDDFIYISVSCLQLYGLFTFYMYLLIFK